VKSRRAGYTIPPRFPSWSILDVLRCDHQPVVLQSLSW
jgi:hypothetical protein